MSAAAEARLHPVVEGVDVRLKVRGRPVKALVVRELLQERFDAGATPQSWLDSYRQHAATIDPVIARRFADDPRQPGILKPGDL
jgi:hypothetical protein